MPANAIVDVSSAPHLGDLDLPTLATLDFHFPSVDEFLASESPPPLSKSDRGLAPTAARPLSHIEPVPIGTSITTTNVKDMNELLQSRKRRLSARFDFTAAKAGFECALTITDLENGEVVKTICSQGCLPSKKHAKETTAGLVIDYLKSLPGITGRTVRGFVSEAQYEVKDGKNWIGLLSGTCNTHYCCDNLTNPG